MKSNRVTQEKLAKLIGTSHTTINRWLKSKHGISGPEQKLLAYLIRGELPFPIQTASAGWNLDFTDAEFSVISMCARREGFASAEEWIVAKIRAYLAMSNTRAHGLSMVAEEETPYKAKNLSS